ncbi:MAG: aldo/keto reductase [Leptolyngbya sp. PLA3]|nr:MAG: aldo/keto reductase [Cyanobacteria bacterium CYA]MCE7970016.1 aldo/keto reductase [Leptolyngbya sp. PL-A3]
MFPEHAAAQPASTAPTTRVTAKSPLTTLNNGVQMPVFGMGTFALPAIQTADVVNFALTHGYRLIDTAANYGNEKEVGEGIARSGVPRSELFITTKLWIEDFGYDEALRAFDLSAQKLGVEQVDLYLLHWPVPSDFEKTIAAYKAVERLYADKRIRAVGVSNFTPEHLTRLLDRTDVVPVLNQIELHPYLTQQAARAAHEQHNIKTESWSPIGGGFRNNPKDPTNVVDLLQDPVLVNLARKHRKTVAQVILRWHNQHGFIVIPKSQHYERLLKNIDIFTFELAAEEMAAIDGLNRDLRCGPDPDTFDIPAFRELIRRRQESGL